MCNCKMCNWLKGLFGKKNCCENKGCCEPKKTEETAASVAPVAPSAPVEEEKAEEVIAPVIEETKEEEKIQ